MPYPKWLSCPSSRGPATGSANSSRSPRPGRDFDMFSVIRYRRNPSAHRSGQPGLRSHRSDRRRGKVPVPELGAHVRHQVVLQRLPPVVPHGEVGRKARPPARRPVQLRHDLPGLPGRLEQQLNLREAAYLIPVFPAPPPPGDLAQTKQGGDVLHP
jgi:hypothetical protein